MNAWATLGIGELTFALGQTIDSTADILAVNAMRAAGMSNVLNLEAGEFSEGLYHSEMAILVMHIDLGTD